jgi:hypothetical protein
MTDTEARAAAKQQLVFNAEPESTPTLTDTELEQILDATGVRRATTWKAATAYRVGDVVQPTTRNGHRYRCTTPGRSDATEQDAVQTVIVTQGGANYTEAPDVSFSGGAGSGAEGYAVIDAGEVVAVVLTSRGTGYTSAPSVSFSGGDGTGATATASIVGIEPAWPTCQSGRVWEGVADASGRQLVWEEAGPDFDNIYDVRRASYLAWDKKAKRVSQFVDTKELHFSQVYDHCIEMRDSFVDVGFS